ncbi:hypothetical protein [Extibacter muris]|uniref:hypothetical protein n=1 Tax=Extibacter muris TaxID=1796622 RepID=UPI001D069996|nr:hypothetical protein [Extibacter muris]MCB6203377.1 hypothetical protein [Extibacter muris]MCQ4664621.1 hypothetical protein [Extibacter muris]MCQ4693896.1 hypothetical protein [Extibacter muris]
MKLIHFQGLNCYHDCLITIANASGLDYTAAFSRLWAEGHLRYDPICSVFLSRRIQETLETMGMRLDTPLTTVKNRETGWAETPAGSYVIIGMDACVIPWSPLYKLLHGPHYFIVQKGDAELHDCFDPTYGINGQTMSAQELILKAYAVISIKIDRSSSLSLNDTHNTLPAQAQEALMAHPETLRHLLEQAHIWMQGSEKERLLPAKYVDCLLTGRYLYRHFLNGQDSAATKAPLFFSHQYYEKWLAVKNGLYKAALSNQTSAAFGESCRLLTCLFEMEVELARHINASL